MITNAKKSSFLYLDYLLLLPIFLLVAVVPLIVYLRIIPIEQPIVPFFDNKTENLDFFSYYKSIMIIVLSALSIISVIISIIFKKIKFKKLYIIFIPIALYLICIVLSAAMSEYPHTAIFGFPDRYEGLLVLLSYIAAFITTIALANSEKQVKILLAGTVAAATIIGIIGLFQYLGLDFFKSEASRMIILSSEYQNVISAIKTSSESTAIYSTLYNPNNFGIYMCMLFSISLSMFIFAKGKFAKPLACIFSCLMLINLIGSNSRGSYIGAFISVILVIILIRKQLYQNWKSLLGIFALYVIIIVGFNSINSGTIAARLESLINTQDLHSENSTIDKIKSFDILANTLSLHCTNSVLKISAKDSQLLFCDDKDTSLSLVPAKEEKGYNIKDERYKDYLILISDNMLKIQKGKSYLYFAIVDNSFLFLNNRGEVVKNTPIETFGFEGKERLGSGRGYIWSRTLPMLKNTILLGHGPDTFAMYFPQHDYVGKLQFMYDANITLDKPHNMYLQTAVNTGLLSLLAILFLLAAYWIGCIKVLFRSKFNDFYSKAGLAVFSAISGYTVSGLFVDSTVSVSPTFWVLLGIGISINHTYNNRNP